MKTSGQSAKRLSVLRERAKELNCLYKIEEIRIDSNAKPETVKMVKSLPAEFC